MCFFKMLAARSFCQLQETTAVEIVRITVTAGGYNWFVLRDGHRD
jgi:hypothetical protein